MMNVLSYTKSQEKKLEDILLEYGSISHESILSSLKQIVSQAYLAGIESSMTKQISKKALSKAQKSLRYKQLSKDFFFDSYKDLVKDQLYSCIKKETQMSIVSQEIVDPFVEEIMKTLYDIAFVNGVEVGKDEDLLAVYEKAKYEYGKS